MKVVLGLDTSCYTTSVAIVSLSGELVSSQRKMLEVEQGKRGLRQSEAVFLHEKQISPLIEKLRGDFFDMEIVAVCASATPRKDEGSYLPVFTAGLSHAESIAAALGVPVYRTNHQMGHIYAARYETGLADESFLAFHLSGGTTDLLSVDGDEITLLGTSLDLHAGQLVDRIGVALSLPFPSGPSLEKEARGNTPSSVIPVSMEKGTASCHLSGAEAALMRLIGEGRLTKGQIAIEVYDLLVRSAARMLEAGLNEKKQKSLLVAGGIASSPLFREMLAARLKKLRIPIKVYFGRPELSGDNAAGVALIGLQKYLSKQEEQ